MPVVQLDTVQRTPRGLDRVVTTGSGQAAAAVAKVGAQVAGFSADVADKLITQRAKVELSRAERTFQTRFQELSQEALRTPDLEGAELARRLDAARAQAESEAEGVFETGRGRDAFDARRERLVGAAERQAAAQVFERQRQVNVENTLGEAEARIEAGVTQGTNDENLSSTWDAVSDLVDGLVATNELSPSQGGATKEQLRKELGFAAATADLNESPEKMLRRLRQHDSPYRLDSRDALAFEMRAMQRIRAAEDKLDSERYGRALDFFETAEANAAALEPLTIIGEDVDDTNALPLELFRERGEELLGEVEDPNRRAALRQRFENSVTKIKAKTAVREFGNAIVSGRLPYDDSNREHRNALSLYISELQSHENFKALSAEDQTNVMLRIARSTGTVPGAITAQLNQAITGSPDQLVQAAMLFDGMNVAIPSEEVESIPESTRNILAYVADSMRGAPPESRSAAADVARDKASKIYNHTNEKFVRELQRTFDRGPARGVPGAATRVPGYVDDLYGDAAEGHFEARAEYSRRMRRNFVATGGDEEAARRLTDQEMRTTFAFFAGEFMKDAPTASYSKSEAAAITDLADFLRQQGFKDIDVDLAPVPGSQGVGSTEYYIVADGEAGPEVLLDEDGNRMTWWPGKAEAELAETEIEARAIRNRLRNAAQIREEKRLEEIERAEQQLNELFPDAD